MDSVGIGGTLKADATAVCCTPPKGQVGGGIRENATAIVGVKGMLQLVAVPTDGLSRYRLDNEGGCYRCLLLK